MAAGEFDERLDGQLVKVVNVLDNGSTAFVRLASGGTARLSFPNPVSFPRGTLLFLAETAYHLAPGATWPDDSSIGVVRKLIDDDIVVESPAGGISVLTGPHQTEVAVGNTIQYNDIEGITRIISETPLRYRETEADDDVSRYIVKSDGEELSFASFGGYEPVIERAKELIETQLERSEELKKIGAKPVKGVIFTGSPGTGKTHLARIIAHVSGATFYVVSGPSIVSQWVGASEATLRRLFEAAAKQKRAIIFFDEIDSIAARRGSDNNGESKRVVAQLLTLLDGFAGDNVIVIAATNRVEDIDEALLRPGRFDWEIEFPLPSESDRLQILQIGAARLKTLDPLPLEDLARLTDDWSGAMLTAIWTEAALLAAGDTRTAISSEDLAIAYERVRSRPVRERAGDGK